MILLPVCTAFFWGLSSIFDKLCLNTFTPIMIFIVGGMVYSIIAIGLFIYHRHEIKHYFYDYIKYKNAWIYAILAGICVYGIANLIYYHVLHNTNNTNIVIAISYSAPIFTLILSLIILKKENYSLASIIGVLFVIIGTVIVCLNS